MKSSVILISLGAGVVIAAVYLLIRYLSAKKTEYRRIRESFGTVPEAADYIYAEEYWETYKNLNGAEEKTDGHTWSNLDMNDVYRRVNACNCAAGDALFYKRLRCYAEEKDIGRQERLIDGFASNRETMFKIIGELRRIGRDTRYSMKILTLTPDVLKYKRDKAVTALALFPLVSLIVYPFDGGIGSALLLFSLVVNFVGTYFLKSRISSFRAVYPLSALIYRSKNISALIRPFDAELAGRIDECLIRCKKVNIPFSLMRYSDLFERMGIPDVTAAAQVPILCYFYLSKFVRSETGTIAKLYELIGEIDVASAVYSFRENLPYFSKPSYTEPKGFSSAGIYLPLLEEAVPNDVETCRGMLITGSNASGKSTFIKTVAVNLILAQAINTCCAKMLRMKRSNVLTAMAVSENIFEGDSYFMAEIKAMKRLVTAAERGDFCYFFIDEILRGTNTVERIAAAYALLMYFRKKNVICFAASHDIELASMTAAEYRQIHFSESVTDNEIEFSYELQDGPSRTRNAIKLLTALDFPRDITALAESAASEYEKNGVSAAVEPRRQK